MANEKLAVVITGKGGQLIQAFRDVANEADSSGKKTHSAWVTAGKGVAVAGVAMAGAAVAVGLSSIKMADDYESSHARLVVSLKNTGTSWDAQRKQIDAVSQASVKFGYTRTDVESALSTMTTGMGSSAKAIEAFQLAEDLAAKTGKPLADAALAVTKASEGQLRPLKQMGIDLPIAAGGAVKVQKAQVALVTSTEGLQLVEQKIHDGRLKGLAASTAFQAASERLRNAQGNLNAAQQTGTAILAALGQKLGGSAAAQAATFGGRMKALHAQMGNVRIAIGTWLIPKLTSLMEITQKVVGWLSKHRAASYALAVVIGGVLLAATIAWTASLFAADGALAILVSPIALVVAGVAALAVGAIYLWTHWNQIWNWISHHKAYAIIIAVVLPITAAVMGIFAAAKYLSDHWSGIWGGIQSAVQAVAAIIMPIIDGIKTGIHDVTSGIGAAGKILQGAGNVISHIPGFAHGGVVPGPLNAPRLIVAHGGEQVISNNDQLGRSGVRPSLVGGGDTHIHLHVSGVIVGTQAELGRIVERALRSSGAQFGSGNYGTRVTFGNG